MNREPEAQSASSDRARAEDKRAQPAWYRRRAVLVTFGVLVVLAVTIISDLPVHGSRAADVSAGRSVMSEVNTDIGPCAFAVQEALTIRGDEAAHLLTASNRSVAPGLLRDDQVACSFTNENIYDLSTIEVPGSAAGKRLGNKDSGVTTQQIQQNVIKNIDELLRKAKEPPPPGGGSGGSSSSSDKDMGGSTQKQQSPGGDSSSSAQRKERREKRNQTAKGSAKDGQSDRQPGAMSSTTAMQSTNGINQSAAPNKIESKTNGLPPRIPDAYKNVWGQLPEKLRQEMDLYFREDFMPRYSDLLRQYYSSLAERDAKDKR